MLKKVDWVYQKAEAWQTSGIVPSREYPSVILVDWFDSSY